MAAGVEVRGYEAAAQQQIIIIAIPKVGLVRTVVILVQVW